MDSLSSITLDEKLSSTPFTISPDVQEVASASHSRVTIDGDSNDRKRSLGPDVLADPRFARLLSPLEPIWSYGLNTKVPIFNISTDNRKQIFCSTGNIGIIYDYCTDTYKAILKGHQSAIVSASTDASERWLVTADSGKENVIFIWDSMSYKSVLSIFNQPPPPSKIEIVAFSPNAKLLIVSSTNERTDQITIDFWLWTFGNETPNDTYHTGLSEGLPKCIKFHPEYQDNIMIVFEKSVLFVTFDYRNGRLKKASHHLSYVKDGSYSSGTYAEHCHEVFVGNTTGCIIVFGNTLYTQPRTAKHFSNARMRIKSVKVYKQGISCIAAVNSHLIVATVSGAIIFFTLRLEILYWITKKLNYSILSISVQYGCKPYIVEKGPGLDMFVPISSVETIEDCEDRSDEYRILFQNEAPTDADISNRVFLNQDFTILTADGMVYLVNPVKVHFSALYTSPADSNVAAIDTHSALTYIVIAYESGRVVLINYETHTQITMTYMKLEPDETLTYIKYGTESETLACCSSLGSVWILHPVLLTEIGPPIKHGTKRICKLVFSANCTELAYYDEDMSVYGCVYRTGNREWIYKGKIRSHYKPITQILFLSQKPYPLYTLGLDRFLIKYLPFSHSEDNEEIDIANRDRIEQIDIPMYIIEYPRTIYNKSNYFLIVDDKHKYKILNEGTTMVTSVYLGPAYMCYYKDPVSKIEFIPQCNKSYFIYMNKRYIGIQKMNIDGNPYKFVGCLAHPDELADFQIDCNGKFLFSFGKSDKSVVMWKINVEAVDRMTSLGGDELQPYYCLIEGGKAGHVFGEIHDLFYYMQILQQRERNVLPKSITNSIRIAELPDLVRACGYFPSEFEIENLLTSARFRDHHRTGIVYDQITFCDFVKLFINHKPVYGYSLVHLNDAFDTLSTYAEGFPSGVITRDDFIEAFTSTGEMLGMEQLNRCLATLLHFDVDMFDHDEAADFSFVPPDIDFDIFIDELMGLKIDPADYPQEYENEYDEED